jgi:hypothetical protein
MRIDPKNYTPAMLSRSTHVHLKRERSRVDALKRKAERRAALKVRPDSIRYGSSPEQLMFQMDEDLVTATPAQRRAFHEDGSALGSGSYTITGSSVQSIHTVECSPNAARNLHLLQRIIDDEDDDDDDEFDSDNEEVHYDYEGGPHGSSNSQG